MWRPDHESNPRPTEKTDSPEQEPTLKNIARELVSHVRKSVTIDWTLREAAQAQIRVLVRRILRKYGYPPDKQEKATQTVLEQAKLLREDWAEATVEIRDSEIITTDDENLRAIEEEQRRYHGPQ